MQTSLTLRVIEAVAEAADADPMSLPPLYDVIDPDALNRLCPAGDGDGTCTVSFDYAGHAIEIRNGHVRAIGKELRP